MGAWCSKLSVARASPPLSGSLSPPTASVLAQETRNGARGLAGVLACIPPSGAAGLLRRPLRSALHEDGGGAKRMKDVGSGVVPDAAPLNDDGQFQHASAEPGSLLSSYRPLGATSDMVLGPSGSAHGVQPMSLLKLDEAKHKVFLSHSGAQKDFVHQLCVDLESMGYFFPFFDQRHHSLPKGKDFAPLIMEAARLCDVAVIVLSKEFLNSKWPMIELAAFYDAQQGGGGKLKFLPLFFKLSIEEVKDESRWMGRWKEHATQDARVDLSKWSAAVKALCKSTGLVFGKDATNEVAYRKCAVKSIFGLSPPNLLFGGFESMVGSSRMCEVVSSQFVEDPSVGAKVLAIYGVAGSGKTMLTKVLHDHFYGEFLGKVCYIDMRNESQACRQARILRMVSGFAKDVLANIVADDGKALIQMKTFMKQERVFLIIDNITYEEDLLHEVKGYLEMGFHLESRIMITSRSEAILERLLPNMMFYIPMPKLSVEEAKALFWKHATSLKTISELTRQQQNILQFCIEKCRFPSEEGGLFHPVALSALADFFYRSGKAIGNQLLVWKDHLEKEMDLVKDVLKKSKKSSNDFFGILGLQFSTFDCRKKLLFLDIVLYSECFGKIFEDCDGMQWLCGLQNVSSPLTLVDDMMELQKSGMICNYDPEVKGFWVPDLYQEFAKWYATDHNINALKNAKGVFQFERRGDSSTPIQCWSNLIRLRISPMTPTNARLVASKRMQELSHLVVLQLSTCRSLKLLNLEGLDCLCDLELADLSTLVTITFSKDKCGGIYDSLQYVRLLQLVSLVHMPDLRPCTCLHSVTIMGCDKVTNFEGADCPSVKKLELWYPTTNQCQRLVDFNCLKSLKEFSFSSDIYEDQYGAFYAAWVRKVDETDGGVEVAMEDLGPYAELFERLCTSSNMVCTSILG